MSSIPKNYNNSVYTLGALLGARNPVQRLEEKKQPYKHDILVLSCTNWRLEKETKKRYGLTSTNVENAITDGDILHAESIREYYSKKIVMLQLHGKRMSTFRTNLANFLSTDGLIVKTDWVGMAYCLPQFHEYDLAIDRMRAERFNYSGKLKYSETKSIKNLVPLIQLSKKTRGTNMVDYWVEDGNEGHPVKLVLKKDNPLIQLWDEIFNRSKDQSKMIALKANYKYHMFDDFHFYTIENLELNTETLANIFCS